MTALKLQIASFCDAGIKPVNEDSVAYYQPAESYPLRTKGVALCVSDGVSTAEAGKEASETAYWLDLLTESGYLDSVHGQSMMADTEELLKILTAIIRTTKRRR